MKRQIKFRAWDGDRMIYDHDNHQGKGRSSGYVLSRYEENVMQFTGLVDRNGKEIYEGDIISNHPLNKNILTDMWYEVAFKKGYYEGRTITHHSICGGYHIDNIGKIDLNFYEVIGNIYEHHQNKGL